MKKLDHFKAAILLCDGFEEIEMTSPRLALEKAGAMVDLITIKKNNSVKAWRHDHWTKKYKVDGTLATVNPDDYDGLVLPGGVMNPDKLRLDKQAIKFIQAFMKKNKPIAAICHGPWTLIETGKINGYKLTSYPSIKSDLINAGARWENKKVVVDDNLVTSRKPDDLPAFNRAMIKLFQSLSS